MATDWKVLVFGDSWADYMHPCWPEVLGRRLSAQVFNFASAGSLCSDLPSQGQRALLSPQVPKAPGGLLRRETLVVIHTCGNDFIMKMVEGVMGGGGLMGLLGPMAGVGGLGGAQQGGPTPEILRANPGAREAEMLRRFMETMYRAGARHFLVSGVPAFLDMPIWNMLWPIIGNMVNQGKLQELGVSPGDPPKLAMEVQAAALHERWESMVADFGKAFGDASCAFFDEVGALERLRERLGAAHFDRSMWDFSMFHPTAFGHEQLACQAHRCAAERFPVLAALAPHPEAAAPQRPQLPHLQPQPQPQQAAGGSSPPAKMMRWTCGVCTLHNKADLMACEACESPRPRAQDFPPVPAAQAGPGAPRPISVRVRNVKGDLCFTVACDAGWQAARLKEAVLAAAPSGFAPEGTSCVLALKGQFLGDGAQPLSDLGIGDGSQVIAVLRPAGAVKPAGK